jgi:hypothetical protein
MVFQHILKKEEIEALEMNDLESYFTWVNQRKKQLQKRVAWNRRLIQFKEQVRSKKDEQHIDAIKTKLLHG